MMLLQELLATKKFQLLEPMELLRQLKGSKFFKRELGRGKQGIAFELQDGTVLKAWVSDPGYESWIDYASNHPNPYYVKVLSKVRKFKTGDITFKYVRLEKLKKSVNRWSEAEIKSLDGFLQDLCGFLNEEYPPYEKALQILKSDMVNKVEKPNLKMLEFTQAIINIASALRGSGFQLDLHYKNFGRREGSNSPVILDPLYANEEYFDVVEIKKILGSKNATN